MKRILFIQVTEPGAYPPLVNAAHLMVDAGWQVSFLASPVAGCTLQVPSRPGIEVMVMPIRSSHVVSKLNYLHYCARAMALALKIKPHVVYTSDPLGALPGLLASKVSGARLLYHEHDSPNNEVCLNGLLRLARRAAFKRASLIVFPNAERARHAQRQSGFNIEKLRIVWNVPLIAALPLLRDKPKLPFVLYYHGSINPERLPETVLEAVASFGGAIRLDVAGYESPGAKGYVQRILSRWNHGELEVIRYLGEQLHTDLLQIAARCHAGLVLMPVGSDDVNMKHMVGASNKVFDYMAAGLPLIVSDISEWRGSYVDAGYGISCDPRTVESVKSALGWLYKNPEIVSEISKNCRAKIELDWHYENEFKKILSFLD
ncbi:MAG: hypothetical protein CFE38_08185 [Comamonadaceae bacterium PBBC1]|nr:MAG: hypothetical protein CFE38_08185 [Comamonadaceae bacterium PBBC1]